jgi:hypothetical protein
MLNFIKDNLLKVLSGILSLIITIVGTAIAIDERYAHAGELEEVRKQAADSINRQQTEMNRSILILRKQNIDDKLFELDVKKSQSKSQQLGPMDDALYQRYNRQAAEIERQLMK